jgi:4-amino-4-deoxy-L-arabinose transferase-like glycosyltransferase
MVTPIPEVTTEFHRLWLYLGTAVQFLFSPFLFLGIFRAFRDSRTWVTLIAFTLLFIGMVMFSFQGRHIVQYFPFAVLLAALGWRESRARVAILVVMALGGAFLAVLYAGLKLA